MDYFKKFDNGLRLVVSKIEGMTSVSFGVLVKTGSVNENEKNNGISHFIEHTVFKGTDKRSAFDISDGIDRIGAQINAFTSKEITCYYTKSTTERFPESAEIISDIFFNARFDSVELEKEKGVIIEEINMSEDTPEDLCLDVLAESYFGKSGLGRPILGSAANVKSFTKKDVLAYMKDFYTADNVVISVAGAIEPKDAEKVVSEYFVNKFKYSIAVKPVIKMQNFSDNLFKTKKIEQSHIALAYKAIKVNDERKYAFSLANVVLGGGMSSRLFQKIREEMGLCYTVYSYPSAYEAEGVLDVYAGVNTDSRNKAFDEIIKLVKEFVKTGITESEFLRAKEQVKSSFILGRESTASQMLLYGKNLLFSGEVFDYKKEMEKVNAITLEDVNEAIKVIDPDCFATATVGPLKTPLK
ncbi:MAG: pitrilysin family protein [Clostridia bacterium]|nr:pitrilysin family protein [Clostridia bacterium]